MTAVYVLFAFSILFPAYTYIVYPIILGIFARFEKIQQYPKSEKKPAVAVVVVGDNVEEKIKNVQQCLYTNMEVISGDYVSVPSAEIIVFTDSETRIDKMAIHEIVKPFSDDRVGCVVGQQTNPNGNSAFWVYENKVRNLESKLGCVSGAPSSLFAVRTSCMPKVEEHVLNKPFFIATKIAENKYAVVFQDSAKAYELNTEGINFSKHVRDAAGYWQALKLFPGMLGSFSYVSHRVLKWFVWLNMIILIGTSGILSLNGDKFMLLVWWIQVVGYIVVVALGRKKLTGIVGKLISIGNYFVMLNVAYFIGMFKG